MRLSEGDVARQVVALVLVTPDTRVISLARGRDCDVIVMNPYLSQEVEPLGDWASLLGGLTRRPERHLPRALAWRRGRSHLPKPSSATSIQPTATWGTDCGRPSQAPTPKVMAFARDVLANAVANVLTSPLRA